MTRLLVVEPAINLKIVSAHGARRYEIVTAKWARALSSHQCIEPYLVLLYVVMPDLNGYEVCRRLLQRANLGHCRS